MTIKRVLAIPAGFEFSVACRGCRHEFTFIVPTMPPGPYSSRCPECEHIYDLAKRDDELPSE
jgi:hypothetical protein